MQIRFHCPDVRCPAIIDYSPLEGCTGSIRCPRCAKDHAMSISSAMRSEHMVDRCAVCGGREMFVRKDFPQRLGLAVVVIFGLASFYYFRSNLLLAWAVLGLAVLIDVIVFIFIGRVTTCYACRSEYRHGALNPDHDGFDLATSEKYG